MAGSRWKRKRKLALDASNRQRLARLHHRHRHRRRRLARTLAQVAAEAVRMVEEAEQCRCSELDPALRREVVVAAVSLVVLGVFRLALLAHRLVVEKEEEEEGMGRGRLVPCVGAW